nr:MAG TPA: hypothetical protein [Herelleviridae sp.]
MLIDNVSTHSRPKAAGKIMMCLRSIKLWFQHTAARRRLVGRTNGDGCFIMFQHTAARRRLVTNYTRAQQVCKVSTHSRPKAAGPRPLRRRLRPLESRPNPCASAAVSRLGIVG